MKFASVFVLSTALVTMGFAPAAFAASPPPSAALPSLDEAAKTLTGEQPAKPTACEIYQFDAKSKLIGKWSLKQRDDGQDWSGPWDVEFRGDGTWSQVEAEGGYWCQDGKLIFFGFEADPHTTYRGELGNDKATGTESWNGGGTGIFEITRIKP
jgi:hypothetical protein